MNNILHKPIILCGFMSSGKTTLGKPLADALGYQFVDTDQMLIDFYHMTIPEIFAKGGETYFRDLEYEIAKKAALLSNTVISTGGGMLTFERNGKLLAKCGTIIYIHKDFEDCYQRLICQTDRPIVTSRTKEQLRAMYETRIALYQKYAAYTLENNGTVEEGFDKLLVLSHSIIPM